MFERYTERARRVIFFSRYEASQFGSPYIESEHLLLGFIRESKALSSKIFGAEFSVDEIRKEIENHTTVLKKTPTSVDLPLTSECRRILHYAADEADRLGHKHIGTEHLFVGILLEKDCYASQLLTARGISLETVRANAALEEPTIELAKAKSPGIPVGYKWKSLLYNPPSGTIIIEMTREDTGHLRLSRLFIRRRSAESYEPIGNPADDLSCESPVTCDKLPIVIFNTVKWEDRGGHPDGLYEFDLESRKLTECLPTAALIIPEPYDDSWILSLVSLADDAKTLHAKVGLKRPVPTGAEVDYYLAKLTLADRKLELLSRLKDIRF